MTIIWLICSLAALFSVVALIFSVGCIAFVVGLRNSTHKLEYRDIPRTKEDLTEEDEVFEPDAPNSGPVGSELVETFKEEMYKDMEDEFM